MAKFFTMDGWVCGEPRESSTANGNIVTEFSINSPERRNIDGEWKTFPNFFRCKYWHRGEHDYRPGYIVNGAHLQLSGEPIYEEWGAEGDKRSAIKFLCRDVLLIAPKGTAPVPKTEPEPVQTSNDGGLYDEEIPF